LPALLICRYQGDTTNNKTESDVGHASGELIAQRYTCRDVYTLFPRAFRIRSHHETVAISRLILKRNSKLPVARKCRFPRSGTCNLILIQTTPRENGVHPFLSQFSPLVIFCENNPTDGQSSCKFLGKTSPDVFNVAHRISPNEKCIYTRFLKETYDQPGKLGNELKRRLPCVDAGDNHFGNSRKLVTESIIVYRRLHAFVKIKRCTAAAALVFVAPENLNLRYMSPLYLNFPGNKVP